MRGLAFLTKATSKIEYVMHQLKLFVENDSPGKFSMPEQLQEYCKSSIVLHFETKVQHNSLLLGKFP